METIVRPAIEPLTRAFTTTYHSTAQLDPLKQATLDILERVGVHFQSAKALALLREHGVRVDEATQVATFPPDVVLAAMARAPRRFTLGARDPSCDIAVGDGSTYCTTDGCGVEIIDFASARAAHLHQGGPRRRARLQDYLSSIAFWWPTLSAGDCGETAQLHELDAGWNNTVKHLQGMVNGEREARYAVEMAGVMAGGPEGLRRRPPMSDLIGTVSPLVLDKDGIEAALVFAEAGVPVCFVTMPTLGTTAPATRAGAFALGSRRAGRRHRPAAARLPRRAGAALHHAELRRPAHGRLRQLPAGHARRARSATELAHHWGVPAESAACGTDSPAPGTWQAGVEEAHRPDARGAGRHASSCPASASSTCTRSSIPSTSPRRRHLPAGALRAAGHRLRRRGPGAGGDRRGGARRALPRPPAHARAHARGVDARHHPRAKPRAAATATPVEVAREQAEWLWREYRPEPLEADKAAALTKILAAADAELRGVERLGRGGLVAPTPVVTPASAVHRRLLRIGHALAGGSHAAGPCAARRDRHRGGVHASVRVAMHRRLVTRWALLAASSRLVALAAPASALADGDDRSRGGGRRGARSRSYIIQNVPLWQQQQALGCGAAAAQMVMDYWGPFVDQREVYNAARTWQGTAVGRRRPRRAVQRARAGRPATTSPASQDWGYTERPWATPASTTARVTPWLDQLKAVVAKGYPVVCLTDWLPGVYGPHYRVVVGYDDTKGVVYVNDPWCRDLKSDIDVRGSYAPNESVQGDHYYNYAEWTYSDWLSGLAAVGRRLGPARLPVLRRAHRAVEGRRERAGEREPRARRST